MYLKRAVDALGGVVTEAGVRACATALLASGACRIANSVTKELQGPVFTPVSQAGRIPFMLVATPGHLRFMYGHGNVVCHAIMHAQCNAPMNVQCSLERYDPSPIH